jgi:hypothetical protein
VLTHWEADIYLISLVIIGSVILFAIGGLRYIDALYFASGSATQAGLNTSVSRFFVIVARELTLICSIDVNKIKTSQQVGVASTDFKRYQSSVLMTSRWSYTSCQ